MQLVGYLRISVKKSGGLDSLGIQGQRSAVELYARQTAGDIIAMYQEVESGRRSDRPELAKALAHAKRSKATVVVARLDRLSRSVVFLGQLQDAKTPFVCCDNPGANELTIGVLACVAQYERKAIAARTRAGLAAAKERGILLGSHRPGHWDGRESARLSGLARGRQVSAMVRRQAANEVYADLLPIMQELRQQGLTFETIASRLTELGHVTRRGRTFGASQILRALKRVS